MVFFDRRRDDNAQPPLLPFEPSSPEGLAARWTRWAAGAGPMHNPLLDTTGEDAHVGQPDDIWFLGGTFGGDVVRDCAVRSGVPLFFPAFNMWSSDTADIPLSAPEAFGHATLDGADVPLTTIATPISFDVAGGRFNPVTRSRKPVAMTVWGLWATIPPLSAGPHTVHFGGGDGHGFSVDAHYRLEITP